MPKATIWNDKIILHVRKDCIPGVLKNYARYNEKMQAYLIWFGQQNLKRLHSAFKDINDPVEILRGQERINQLKLTLSTFKDIRAKVMHIKTTSTLPEINYKVDPLGFYQHRGVHFLINSPIAPLFADCGLGKSYQVLTSSEYHILTGVIARGKTLICGKLPTLETGWMEDVEKFTNLKAVMVWLPPSTYKRKEKMLKLLEEPADLYITNHETIMTLEEDLAAKKFQKVVVDESTILKSFRGEGSRSGGKFGKSLMKVAAEATWRVIMSGTPAPNGSEDLWGQFNFLDPDGILLEPSFSDFQNTYMKKIYFGKPPKIDAVTGRSTPEPPHKWVTPNDKVPLIKELVLPFVYQVKIRDHLKDLPERTIIKRPVLMSAEQHEHYIEMRTALSTIINDQMVAISVRIAQVTKLRQITGGFLIDQTEKAHEIESATKLNSLDDLLEEIGDEKVVIYAQYRWEIKTIAQRYKNKGVVTVFGENKVEDSLENIKEFIKNPDVKIIVLNPKSCAYGITFVVSHYMIFYSISHSELENYQCIKRIERAGQKHPMFIYYLISRFAKHVEGKKGEAAKTIDEAIYDTLQLKAKNQEELLDQTSVDMNILRNL